MKKTMKVLLTCIVSVFLLCGCTAEMKSNQEIDGLISRFEKACQSADLSDIAECMDPVLTGPILSLMGTFDADFETADSAIDYVLGDSSFLSEFSEYRENRDKLKELLQSLKIKPVSYDYNESKDRCTVKATFTIEHNGETESEENFIYCVKKDGEWYITFNW